MKLRVIARLIEIQRVLVRHGLDEFVRATHLYRPLRFLFLLSPWTWVVRRKETKPILVTDGNFTYVSIDDQGRPQAINQDGSLLTT